MKNLNYSWKYLLLFLLSFFFIPTFSLFAVPANPRAIETIQPDGKIIKVKMRGDEHFSWHEDVNGYVVKRDKSDGFWKYAVPKKNEVAFDVLPDDKVGETNPQAKGLKKGNLPDRKLIQEKINARRNKVVTQVAPARAPAPANNTQAAPAQSSSSPVTPPVLRIPVSGTATVKNIVILACFSDQWSGGTVASPYGKTPADYLSLFNDAGYSIDGALGSVKDYYREVSYGKVTVETIVVPWVLLPQNQAYYGANGSGVIDVNAEAMITDAINAADAVFDFSQGDGDGDGWVDCLTIIHSGYGEEGDNNSSECIWSHQSGLASAVTKDGVKMCTYHTEPACREGDTPPLGHITRIGVICHEMGHFFGLPDLYDYSDTITGLGNWCLMSHGAWNGPDLSGNSPAHFSAWCKASLGFVNPKLVHSDTSVPLRQVEDYKDINLLRDSCSNGEYFLIENRQKSGFDTYIPGAGIIIYHVDSKNYNNDLGTYPHPLVKIEEADGNDTLGINLDPGQATDAWTSTNGLSGGFRDQTGNTSSNSMMYKVGSDYLRTNTSSSYTYNTLNSFSASGATMTYNISSLVPTVQEQATVTASNYTVSWTASQGASKYEIQEGPEFQTSFSDGAETEDAMWENWSIGGGAMRTNAGYKSGGYSYYFTPYDGSNRYSSISSLTMRETIKITSNINLSFYYECDTEANNGYLKLQASKDDGDTWKTIWTHNGGLVLDWTQISKTTSDFIDLGFSEGDVIKLRYVMNTEAIIGGDTFPAFGWAIDDISITNTYYTGFAGTTLSNAVVPTSYPISDKISGNYKYRVRAYANSDWQEWSPYATVKVDISGPRIDVKGNNLLIADGDTDPSTADHTYFGTVDTNGATLTRTFTISNPGIEALNIAGTPIVSISPSDFTVTTLPSSPVASGGSTTFQITFDPSASGPRYATVSIVNDVPGKNPYNFNIKGMGVNPGTLQFSAATYSQTEFAGTATVSVTRAGGSEGDVSVNYATSNGTATAGSDYTAASGTLNWSSGTSDTKTITVSIINDTTAEGDETVNLTLSGVTGATLGSQSTAVLTIVDNDFTLTMLNSEGGTASSSDIVNGSYSSTAKISATSSANYYFKNWTAVGPVTITNENSESTSISYTGNATLTANFVHITAALTMAVYGGGSVTPVSKTVNTATAILINATANLGSSFAGWSVVGSGTIDNTQANPANATLTGNATVTANFITGTATNYTLGSPETGISDLEAGLRKKYYTVTVAPGNSLLEITTSGNGDCDMYVRFGAAPNLSAYDKLVTGINSSEKLRIANPTPGTWYIMLYAYSSYDTLTLTATVGDFAIGKPVLTVTPQTDNIHLAWSAVASGSPDAYEIYRAEQDDIEVATKIEEVGSAVLSYDDIFSAGTANYDYYYWVRAVTKNISGKISDEGEFSDSAHASKSDGKSTPLVNGKVKTPVSGTEGSIQTFTITVPVGQSLLEIKATGLTGDCDIDVGINGGTAKNYSVSGSANETIQIVDPDAGSWVIHLYGKTAYSGVSLMAKYYSAIPAVPAGLVASDGLFDDRILLNWKTVPGATSYEIFRNASKLGPGNKISEVADNTYEDKNVVAGVFYYYFVTAKNNEGASKPSSGNSGYLIKAPANPSAVTASDGIYFDKIRVSWTKIAGATSYLVYRTKDALATPDPDIDLPFSETNALFLDDFGDDITPIDGGIVQLYYYWMAAKNQSGTTLISKTNAGYLSKKGPAKITASNGTYSDRIIVTWAPVPGATTYDVYRYTDKLMTKDETRNGNAVAALEYADTTPVKDTVYYYRVKAKYGIKYDSDFSSGTAGMAANSYSPIATLLGNGVESGNVVNVGKGEGPYFSAEVPFGTARLLATLDGFPAPVGLVNDCDLFAKFANFPTSKSFNAKGVENKVAGTEVLTVSNPASGTWYFLLYGTMAYTNVTLTVNCYTAADIMLTQVPANNLAVPFTAAFKGKVVDESGTGIPAMTVQVRNPITGLTSFLTKTDKSGLFSYSTTISNEGEHTFDFFFTEIPDNAKGTASHTVATRKGCFVTNNFFDFSSYLPATPIAVPLQADIVGLQTFLDIRNGWTDGVIDTVTYEPMWVNGTIVAASTDSSLLGKLDEGLYMFFYGVEGAGAGNDMTAGSALSTVPFVVHVVSGATTATVLGNLKTLGIIDDTQMNAVLSGEKIGVVTVAAFSNPGEGAVAGDKNISLLAREQLEVLANLAGGNGTFPEDGKYSDVLTRKFTVDIGGAKKTNVITSAFVK